MKKIIVAALFAAILKTSFAQGQFKIRNDSYIQIGYSTYKALTFGQSTNLATNNGNFALEYCSGCTGNGSGGFNIWKPWPTTNSGNFLFYIRDNGNIGVGNIGDNNTKMWISGNLKVNSTTYTSDLRFKENITTLDSTLDDFLQIKPYQYTFKQKTYNKLNDSLNVNVNKDNTINYNFDDKLHFGLIAQDVQKIYPNLVTEDEKGYLALNYVELIPVLINAVQIQNDKIAKLEALILTLKK
jgi:hypothetical protein